MDMGIFRRWSISALIILSALFLSMVRADAFSVPPTRASAPVEIRDVTPNSRVTAPVRIVQAGAASSGTPRPPQERYLDVIDALETAGYTLLSVRETMLNRVQIRARNALHLREIVLSRASGDILRDVALETYTTGPDEMERRLRDLPGFGYR